MFFHSKKIILPVNISEVKKELAKETHENFKCRFVSTGKYEIEAHESHFVFTNNHNEPYYPITTYLFVEGNEYKTCFELRSFPRVEIFVLAAVLVIIGLFVYNRESTDSFIGFVAIAPLVFLFLQSKYFIQDRGLNLSVCHYFIDKFTEGEC